jgi:electron transport complex protein RnfB
MTLEIYQRLAKHLDNLPGGFPPTPDGLELRIVERLFTPEQAEIAVNLSLIPESPALIARRVGFPLEKTQQMLAEMADQGLLMDVRRPNRETRYMAAQFAIGIWEYQVKRLTPELAADVGEYLKTLIKPEIWGKAPQLRTIPVGESIPNSAEVMPYEQAGVILKRFTKFAVAPCICREEKGFFGESCGKPLETCLLMGGAAESYLDHLRAREISYEEAVHILEIADQAGLVLQPVNTQDSANFCCCCGDCCGVLRNIKRHPQPSRVMASAFYAVLEQELCNACGTCIDRCQMDAITIDSYAHINLDRCIGCGLCVTTCEKEAIQLNRKPENEVPHVPQNTIELYARVARARGVLPEIGKMAFRSGMDRLRSR